MEEEGKADGSEIRHLTSVKVASEEQKEAGHEKAG